MPEPNASGPEQPARGKKELRRKERSDYSMKKSFPPSQAPRPQGLTLPVGLKEYAIPTKGPHWQLRALPGMGLEFAKTAPRRGCDAEGYQCRTCYRNQSFRICTFITEEEKIFEKKLIIK